MPNFPEILTKRKGDSELKPLLVISAFLAIFLLSTFLAGKHIAFLQVNNSKKALSFNDQIETIELEQLSIHNPELRETYQEQKEEKINEKVIHKAQKILQKTKNKDISTIFSSKQK